MAAAKTATTQRRSVRKQRDVATEQMAPAVPAAAPRRGRRSPASTAQAAEPATAPRRAPIRAATKRSTPAAPPSAAPCVDLERLQSLGPEAAREYVECYLHNVMSGSEADAFEASSYRWELHLVEIEQLRLVRGVDLDRKKVRRYHTVLKRGGAFPALIGLGGDGHDVTRDVLLCDGYHRAAAMRDYGVHYVWAWLATGVWRPASASFATATPTAAATRE